jgi:putative hydrolase of the HAD superfamily
MLSNLGEVTFYKIKDALLPIFDDFVLSYTTGISKPDPRAYELAATRLGLEPEECIFIDNDPNNCRAAATVGMQAVVFTDTLALRKELGLLLADTDHQAPLRAE